MVWWILGIISGLISLWIIPLVPGVARGKVKLLEAGTLGWIVFHAGTGIFALFCFMKAVK